MREIKEYVVTYSIFAHRRYKAITMKGTSKNAVAEEFRKTHPVDQYKIKGIEVAGEEDFEVGRVWNV